MYNNILMSKLKEICEFYKNVVARCFVPTLAVYNLKYTLVFKTTNYCWFKCQHCCENSGPDQEKTYIDSKIICDYLAQAKQDPQFSNDVIFTGGEVFSAYKFGDKNYVKDILNFALQNNISTNIKTNAGWARTSWGQQIFTDLKELARSQKTRLPLLSISLSIDNYHTNCVDNAMAVMDKLVGENIAITVASFPNAQDKVKQFEKNLPKKFYAQRLYTTSGNQYILLNNKTFYSSGCATLFNGGRAIQMPDAYNNPAPQFAFIVNGNQPSTLFAFDNFGRVSLGENAGRKIMTPWINQYKEIRPLQEIKQSLRKNTLKENLYFIFYEQLFR